MRLRARRALLLALVTFGFITAAGAVSWIARSGAPTTAEGKAGVLAAYAVVAGALWGLLKWALAQWPETNSEVLETGTPEQVESAADLLAERTLRSWAEQATRRGIVTPSPVRVRWSWAAPNLGATREDLNRSPAMDVDPAPFTDQSAEVLASGVVTRLHDEVY